MQALWQNKIMSLCEKMKIPFPLPLGRDALLSGSFMWHVLTSDETTKWSPNDVDIFCGLSALDRLREFLIGKGFVLKYIFSKNYIEPESRERFFVEEWQTNSSAHSELSSKDLDTLSYYRNYCQGLGIPIIPLNTKFSTSESSSKIQLIYSKSCVLDPTKFIVDRFDLPILENYFDGETVVISHPDQVETRTTKVRPIPEGKEWPRSVVSGRMLKYSKRGIKFEAGSGFLKI